MLASYFVNLADDIDDISGAVCVPDQVAGNDNCTLRLATQLAAASAESDTITIAPGTYFVDPINGPFQLGESSDGGDITFIGEPTIRIPVVIDGQNQSGLFDLGNFESTFTFQAMTFQNGLANDSHGGGAFLSLTPVNLVLEDVIVQDNRAEVDPINGIGPLSGGAISVDGNVTISDSAFLRNSATGNAGAIRLVNQTGNQGTLSITNTQFVSNSAGSTADDVSLGGAIFVEADTSPTDLILDSVSFELNTSGGSGGAVYAIGTTTSITGSSFNENTATGTDGGAGAVYLIDNAPTPPTFLIGSSTFTNNSSIGGGGAFESVGNNGTISDSTFRFNSVTGTSIDFQNGGGAIVLLPSDTTPADPPNTVTISNSTIDQNTATAAGGIAIVNVDVGIFDSVISANQAVRFGIPVAGTLNGVAGGIGIAADNGADLFLLDSQIINNTASLDAGGIGGLDVDITIVRSTIDGNTAGDTMNIGRGGGIGLQGSSDVQNDFTLEIDSSTISNNQATGDGGGIAIVGPSFILENATISSNQSTQGSGGGIAYIGLGNPEPFIVLSTIANNTASGIGSNMIVSGTTIQVQGSIFAGGSTFPAPGFTFTSLGENIDSGTSMGFTQATDLIDTDPLLGPLQDNGGRVSTHALLTGSPAIDSSSITSDPFGGSFFEDARGITRPQDGDGDGIALADRGAFEAEQVAATLTLGGELFLDTGPGSLFGNGILDASESLFFPTVTVELFRANQNPGSDSPLATASTDNGSYRFAGLAAGNYRVFIPLSNFASGGPLFNFGPTDVTSPDPNNDVDGDDNSIALGASSGSFFGVSTEGFITLAPGTEPINDADTDPNTNTTLDFAFVPIPFPVDLAITKNLQAGDSVNVGEAFTYEITVTNLGPGTAENVFVTDILPDSLSFISLDAGGSAITSDVSGQTVTFDLGQVPVGSSTFRFDVFVDSGATGSIISTATVSTISTDRDSANNSVTNTLSLGPAFDIVVTNTVNVATASAGDTVIYSVNLTNQGPDAATNVVLSNAVPAGLTFVSSFLNGTSGTLDNGIVSFPAISLSSGAANAATATLTFTVNAAASGVIANTASVPDLTSAGETDITNNSATVATTIDPITGSIAGTVYIDANNNGVQDAGEVGIAGVTLQLTGTDSLGNAVDQTVTTNLAGDYLFAQLAGGVYSLAETQPAGFSDGQEALGTGATANVGNDIFTNIVLPPAAMATEFDFGELDSVAILSGHLFCDSNASGVEDSGEAISGAIVFLDTNGNREFDSGEVHTTTDGLGDYQFTTVPGGEMIVVAEIPETCVAIPSNPGVVRTLLDAGNVATSIAAYDRDFDGDLDLLITSDLDGSLTIFQNTFGDFTLGSTEVLGPRLQKISTRAGSEVSSPTMAIVGVGMGANEGNLHLGSDTLETVSIPGGPIDVLIDSLTSDFSTEIVTASFRSSTLHIVSANGSFAPREIQTSTSQLLSIASGDIDGDSDIDLIATGSGYRPTDVTIVGGTEDSEINILLNDGEGNFAQDSSATSLPRGKYVAVEAVDLDSDGKSEIIAVSQEEFGSTLSVFSFENNGFQTVSQTSIAAEVTGIAVGDLNRDSIPDVVVVSESQDSVLFFVGDSDFGFQLIQTVFDVPSPSAVTIADLDGDGRGEVAVTNRFRHAISSSDTSPLLPSTATVLRLQVAQQEVLIQQSPVTANFAFPSAELQARFDVNSDNRISMMDALQVINDISLPSSTSVQEAEAEAISNEKVWKATDVNLDGSATALDALIIINHLQREASTFVPAEPSFRAIAVDDDGENQSHIKATDEVIAAGLF
ncbi:SdrD B-like domain-containing protein [Rubripirellula obstinata]|uniref:SdrD B-like domain-containing protein n=1 Tax=Rubripirellula obstinata TaxID=406547 RepID=UPI00082E5C7C|nr:SdrD B-like domain-containing protein [Rubripirellula obstinata]